MADPKSPTSETNPENPPEPTPEELENQFFDKMMGRMDTWFNGKVEELRKTSTSRSGGRTTLPSLIGNFMFGPEKKD